MISWEWIVLLVVTCLMNVNAMFKLGVSLGILVGKQLYYSVTMYVSFLAIQNLNHLNESKSSEFEEVLPVHIWIYLRFILACLQILPHFVMMLAHSWSRAGKFLLNQLGGMSGYFDNMEKCCYALVMMVILNGSFLIFTRNPLIIANEIRTMKLWVYVLVTRTIIPILKENKWNDWFDFLPTLEE